MNRLMVPIVNRTNYTKLRPILTSLNNEDIELNIIPSSGLVVTSLGDGIKDIVEDLDIHSMIDCLLKNDTPESLSKSIGISIIEHAKTIRELKPQALLVVGDRFDMISSVIPALMDNVPILHIQGGEQTGCIDDKIRDMISMCSSHHYVSTELSAERLRRITGSNNVFNYGCPAVEFISNFPIENKLNVKNFHKHFKDDIPIRPNEEYFLTIVHPNTVEYNDIDMEIVLESVEDFGLKNIIIYPNVDTYNSKIINAIRKHNKNIIKIKHCPMEDFAQLMAHASCMIGNSSAGIRESASFATPTVNIGTRQQNRERNNNVVDCVCSKESIVSAINEAMSLQLTTNNIYYQPGGIQKICSSIMDFIK